MPPKPAVSKRSASEPSADVEVRNTESVFRNNLVNIFFQLIQFIKSFTSFIDRKMTLMLKLMKLVKVKKMK